MNLKFENQLSLLLRVLPFIAKEKVFALHGGTAINLFYQNMPRLSVDIDLTYIPINNRYDDLENIRRVLVKIADNLLKYIPNISVKAPIKLDDELKLYCLWQGALIKVEVNMINRGLMDTPVLMGLCEQAQEKFNVFTEIQTVPLSQLYGGKLVAALDRQHPRDIFDVKKMLETITYSKEIQKGLIFCLLSSKRPFNELLSPSIINQKVVLTSQFDGMTNEEFTYNMFEMTRFALIEMVNSNLNKQDKELLISFTAGNPVWQKYDYSIFPGIRWKLRNINKLKKDNYSKFKKQLNIITKILS